MPDTARLTTALGDRYVIERELGAGGMATVYLARDLKHDREVALKVLRPELGAVLGTDRFLAEIKITARLDHPHILTLIDSGASDGFLYYVLPYVRGESLRDKLVREKQLGIDEALTITKQVASALDYAHRQGVVHRDIKPENILIQEGEAMLADFGIALAVKEAGGNRLTETGLSLGTPQYMSPEQATGDRTLDARSDVYSLAAVLYEMLTGEPPVTGATAQAMIAKLMTERPSRIRIVRDTVPEGIDNAVAKALAKVPADRFASAGEFAASLSNTAVPGHRGTTPSNRNALRYLIAVAGVLAVAVVVLLWTKSGGGVRVIQPDRQQVTFTGNARTPALSPDGQRLAYSARQCNADGYCTYDVVVQDVGGAGTSTVLHGWASVWEIDWTSDARYLLISGFEGQSGRWGPFIVPSLGGGTPRWLGCCDAHLGAGDTALVTRGTATDSRFWLLWVTVSDGVAHDSLTMPRAPGTFTAGRLLDGGRLLLVRRYAGGQTVLTADRAGRMRDSLRIDDPRFEIIGPTRDGRAILFERRAESRTGEFDLLAYALGDDGRINPDADVTLRQLNGSVSLGRNGMLTSASGPLDYEVWMLRRDAPGAMRFAQRRLAAGTAPMGGLVSPTAERVLIWRRVIQGGKALTQTSVMASDSGPETLLGPPLDYADYEWTADGQGLVIGISRGDSVDVKTQEVPSGRTRPLVSLARRDFDGMWAMPGGGALVRNPSSQSFRLVGVAGRPDTTFAYGEGEGTMETFAVSPDGREVVVVGWEPHADSVVARRVSLVTGQVVRLWAFYADGFQQPIWLKDGTVLLSIRETGSTLVWYRLPAAGGRPVRLGTPPHATDATFRMSADGRRVVARVTNSRTDIYLIRNFAELMRH